MKRNDPTWNPWHGCHIFIKGGKKYHIKDYKTQIEQALASGLQNRKNPKIIEKQEQELELENKTENEQLTLFYEGEIKMTREGIMEFIKNKKHLSFHQ